MARVSPHKLQKSVQDDLLLCFIKVLSRSHKTNGIEFLRALFTDEEQIMLAKRIAVVSMFREELSVYRITQVLKMSSSTVVRMKRAYDVGTYNALASALGRSKKEREALWETIEIILRAGMPPRGKGRWASVIKRLRAP